jgi:hypothetical protein
VQHRAHVVDDRGVGRQTDGGFVQPNDLAQFALVVARGARGGEGGFLGFTSGNSRSREMQISKYSLGCAGGA